MGAAHRGDSIQGNVSATVEKPNGQKRDTKAEKKHMKCLESREGHQCSGLQSKTLLLLLWPLSGGCCVGVGTAEEGDRDLGVGSKCCCCC